MVEVPTLEFVKILKIDQMAIFFLKIHCFNALFRDAKMNISKKCNVGTLNNLCRLISSNFYMICLADFFQSCP